MLNNKETSSFPPQNDRLYFVDNLRTFVIVLVVIVHVAIVYGGLGSEAITNTQPSGLATFILAWFSFANLAFFMGLLFFIAGYFTPASFLRQGGLHFIARRLMRLGIPLIFYDFLINPPIQYLRMSNLNNTAPSITHFLHTYFDYVKGIGTGPMWFVSNLLLFCSVYALVCTLAHYRPLKIEAEKGAPGNLAIFIFMAIIAIAAFVLRLVFPIGWQSFTNLRLPYYWQYLTFFIIGTIAWQRQWLSKWPESIGKLWLSVGVISALLFPGLMLVGDFEKIRGGFQFPAMIFSIWESLISIGIGLGLLLFFRKHYNKQGKLAHAMSASAYTVYIIHVPVIVLLQLAFQGSMLPALMKFVIVSLIAVSISFFVSHFVLLRIPMARKIL
jgi:peptidoglycan/LPS O-acetylase OafA/YrhL